MRNGVLLSVAMEVLYRGASFELSGLKKRSSRDWGLKAPTHYHTSHRASYNASNIRSVWGPSHSTSYGMKLVWSDQTCLIFCGRSLDVWSWIWSVWGHFMQDISLLAIKVARLLSWHNTRLMNEWSYKQKYIKNAICNYFLIFYWNINIQIYILLLYKGI